MATSQQAPAVDMEQRYQERLRRYVTAMRKGKPDKVPIRPFVAEFTALYAGYTVQEVTQDYQKAFEAARRCAADFDWDAVVPNMVYGWAGLVQAIGLRYYATPGVELPPEKLPGIQKVAVARTNQRGKLVVVATDIGISKVARDMAAKLGVPLAIMEKRRIGNIEATETLNVIGEVEGMRALTIDDEIDTASSLVGVVDALLKRGATEIYACCTHPVLSGPAIQRIADCPVKEVVVTDTIPLSENKRLDKITVLSVASLIGEAIHRIHTGLSVGAMFHE